jgi:hypothetical protein
MEGRGAAVSFPEVARVSLLLQTARKITGADKAGSRVMDAKIISPAVKLPGCGVEQSQVVQSLGMSGATPPQDTACFYIT